jgi:hypothetical protein
VIAPVVEPLGYAAVRADQISEAGVITTQVIQRIVEDELVVADLTGSNPNVFYELALRHAAAKPLVQLVAQGEQIPFDVAGMRTVHVDVTDLDSVDEAKTQIRRQIESLERDPASLETPVSFAMQLRFLRQSDDPGGQPLADIIEAMSEMKADLRRIAGRDDMEVVRERETRRAVEERLRIREAELQRLLHDLRGKEIEQGIWRETVRRAQEVLQLATTAVSEGGSRESVHLVHAAAVRLVQHLAD